MRFTRIPFTVIWLPLLAFFFKQPVFYVEHNSNPSNITGHEVVAASFTADLVLEVGMRHRRPPLQVPGDAAGLESVPQPRARDLFGVCRPVAGAGRLVQPVLQLSLQLQEQSRAREGEVSSVGGGGRSPGPLEEFTTLGRSRKRCLEERMTGVCRHTLHWGSCRGQRSGAAWLSFRVHSFQKPVFYVCFLFQRRF